MGFVDDKGCMWVLEPDNNGGVVGYIQSSDRGHALSEGGAVEGLQKCGLAPLPLAADYQTIAILMGAKR